MKTKFTLLTAAAILLASCSTRIELVKRKYNKGYYVSVTKKDHHSGATGSEASVAKHKHRANTPDAEKPETALVASTAQAPETTPKPQQITASAQGHAKTAVASHNHHKAIPASTNRHHAKSGKSEMTANDDVARKVIGTSSSKHYFGKATKGGGADANAVVLIILCIFLPPLAVYLFKKSIDTNFWVDLILTILGWLPGMIFAFLVCFAGVSL